MTDYQTIQVTQENAGVFITLNRPEVHNALNETMIGELTQAIQRAAGPSQSIFVSFRGGKSFCAGADVQGMHRMAMNTFQENMGQRGSWLICLRRFIKAHFR